ncbi:MAG: O-antigen ligase family protein [candidate division Zixibacteria bacterium]|nr:O-antigen ligase family protein [candidate division Zixibacteria bacterium]
MQEVQTINTPTLLSKRFLLLALLVIICGAIANFYPVAALIPFGFVLFIYFWRNQDKFVLFLIAYSPFEEIILKSLPDQFYAPIRFLWEGLLFAMMFAMLFDKLALKRKWQRTPIDLPVCIFLFGWVVSGLINSVSLNTSLLNLKNLIRYIPLFYIIYGLKPKTEFLSRVVKLILAIAIIQSAICLWEAFDPDVAGWFTPNDVIVGGELVRGEDSQLGTYYTRFSGTMVRNVHLGNYLAFALCFLVAMYSRIHLKGWFILSMILILTALFISSSRISWFSAYAGIGMILTMQRHRWRYHFWLTPIVGLAGVMLVGLVAPNGDLASDFNIVSRFFHIFSSDYLDTISNAGRLYAILYAMPAVLMTNPLLGLGPGAFIQISKQFSAADSFGQAAELGLNAGALNYVHDVGYVSLFAQAGLIGLGSYIWIFVRLYKIAKKTIVDIDNQEARDFMLGAVGFMLAVMIQNLASFNLMYRNQSVIIWTIAGLIGLFAVRKNISAAGEINQWGQANQGISS